jgi:hypothetical protein
MITATFLLNELSNSSSCELSNDSTSNSNYFHNNKENDKQQLNNIQHSIIQLDSESSNDSISFYQAKPSRFYTPKKTPTKNKKKIRKTPSKNTTKKQTIVQTEESPTSTGWLTPERRRTNGLKRLNTIETTTSSPSTTNASTKRRKTSSSNFKKLSPPQQNFKVQSNKNKKQSKKSNQKKSNNNAVQLRISDMFMNSKQKKQVEQQQQQSEPEEPQIIYSLSPTSDENSNDDPSTPEKLKPLSPMQISPEYDNTSSETTSAPSILSEDAQTCKTPDDKSTSNKRCDEYQSPDSLIDLQLFNLETDTKQLTETDPPEDNTQIEEEESKPMEESVTLITPTNPTQPSLEKPSDPVIFNGDSLTQTNVNSNSDSCLSLSLIIESDDSTDDELTENQIDLLPRPSSPVLPFLPSLDFNEIEEEISIAKSLTSQMDDYTQVDSYPIYPDQYSIDFAEPTLPVLADADLLDHLDSAQHNIHSQQSMIFSSGSSNGGGYDTVAPVMNYNTFIPQLRMYQSIPSVSVDVSDPNIIASLNPSIYEMSQIYQPQQRPTLPHPTFNPYDTNPLSQHPVFNLITSNSQVISPQQNILPVSKKNKKSVFIKKQTIQNRDIAAKKEEELEERIVPVITTVPVKQQPAEDEIIITEEDKFKEIISSSQVNTNQGRVTRSSNKAKAIVNKNVEKVTSPLASKRKKFVPPRSISTKQVLATSEPMKKTVSVPPLKSVNSNSKQKQHSVTPVEPKKSKAILFNELQYCSLCHERVSEDDDIAGPICLNDSINLFFHSECILYSGVSEDNTKDIIGLYHKGLKTACSHCKKMGATLKCANTTCSTKFHYPCVKKLSRDPEMPTIINSDEYLIYCEPSHIHVLPSYL